MIINLWIENNIFKEPEVLAGNDITNLEAVKWLLRSPFDSNVTTQFDVQVKLTFWFNWFYLWINYRKRFLTILLVIWELTLKQLIIQLSLMKQFVYLFGQDQVCCLFYKVIYIYFKLCLDIEELLFECYQVPSVLFGVDSLFIFF